MSFFVFFLKVSLSLSHMSLTWISLLFSKTVFLPHLLLSKSCCFYINNSVHTICCYKLSFRLLIIVIRVVCSYKMYTFIEICLFSCRLWLWATWHFSDNIKFLWLVSSFFSFFASVSTQRDMTTTKRKPTNPTNNDDKIKRKL